MGREFDIPDGKEPFRRGKTPPKDSALIGQSLFKLEMEQLVEEEALSQATVWIGPREERSLDERYALIVRESLDPTTDQPENAIVLGMTGKLWFASFSDGYYDMSSAVELPLEDYKKEEDAVVAAIKRARASSPQVPQNS